MPSKTAPVSVMEQRKIWVVAVVKLHLMEQQVAVQMVLDRMMKRRTVPACVVVML